MPSYWRQNFYTEQKQICPDTQASIACVPVVDFYRSCVDPMTIHKLDRIAWRYTGCANMNFLCQVFRNLLSDRETEVTEIINHASLQVVNTYI